MCWLTVGNYPVCQWSPYWTCLAYNFIKRCQRVSLQCILHALTFSVCEAKQLCDRVVVFLITCCLTWMYDARITSTQIHKLSIKTANNHREIVCRCLWVSRNNVCINRSSALHTTVAVQKITRIWLYQETSWSSVLHISFCNFTQCVCLPLLALS